MKTKTKPELIFVIAIVFIALLLITLCSCSVNNELTKPRESDLVIIHTDGNYVFVCPAKEVKTLYWKEADTLKVWSFLVEN
jgi:hypothetical protein